MKIPYFCCIGAELKRYMKDFDFMNQVYLYKVPTDDSIDEVLAQDYFKAISDSVLQDDIVYIYEASAKILHECIFDKQNGHITAVPLASDETIIGAATSIIHDNLTPNKILISDQDGKVAAGDMSLEYIKDTLSVLHCSVILSNTIDTMTVVMLDELTAFEHLDSRPSYKAPGAIVVDNDGNAGIIESIDTENQTANVITTFVAVVRNFTGATATETGESGLVPAPSAGDEDKILFGDGSWKKITVSANKAVISDAQGHLSTTETTSTELGFLHGVTSAVQAQIDKKQDKLVSGTNIKTINGETLLGSGDVKIESGTGRNIGDIFYTTRTDTAFAGAVECNGGTYSTADYVGDGSIGELLASGKLPYVSLAEYATQITNNGVCGVFGWDGTGTTTFRVPTLQDMFIECGQTAQLGNYIPAGLPNITGQSNVWGANSESGALKTTITGTAGIGNNVYSVAGNIRLDASKSNAIYGNSNTVQPKAIKYRAMVQLFNGTTDEAVATVGTVVAQVGELRNMSNITATGKETVVGWGMPDYSAGISLSGWGTATSNFSVPTDGVLQITISSTSAFEEFFVDDKIACALANASNYIGWAVNLFPVSKGTHTWRTSSTPSRIYAVVFYPFKGVN